MAIIYIGAFIFVLVLLFEVVRLFSKNGEVEAKLPYRLRPYFFNKSEATFFFELNKSLPPNFYIFPKVRMIDFVEPTNHQYKWRNKIWSRHVDFLICDQFFKPVTAIEVNGGYHNTEKQREKDWGKREILENASIPLVFVNVGVDFQATIEEIKKNLLT